MQLTGKQLHQIQEALLSAFSSKDQLAMMVRLELEQNLHAIAGGDSLRVVMFKLVTWAESNGRVADLLAGAINQNPGNAMLQQLVQDARGWAPSAQAAPPSPTERTQSRRSAPTPAVIDIFLSHSRLDVPLMQRLHADLRAAGFAVWIDEGLEPGTPHWEAAIEEAIRQARCLLVILTPSAKASYWVQSEIGYARAWGRPIYPLLAAGDVRSAIPLGLVNAQHVDIRQDYGAVATELLPGLRSYLHGGATPTMSEPPPAFTASSPMVFDWAEIPAGDFKMGSNEYDDEKPLHTVHLPAYRIAKTPVTVAQFAQFCQATGYTTTAEIEGSAWSWTGEKWADIKEAYWARPRGPASNVDQKSDHPVTCVSWHDAMAFCQWAGVRLPTEAEWEKAARGTDGRTFPWGESEPDENRCNFKMDVGDTMPVGNYPKGTSPYGCLDMAGNVWEWCSSQHKPYPYKADDGREDLAADGPRVWRGGAFDFFVNGVRCAYRDFKWYPDVRDYRLGFRVISPVS